MGPRTLVLAAALTLVALASRPSAADADARSSTTNTSAIAQFMVLEPGDRNFKLFHGAVWLDADKAQYNYRWGGAQCGNRDLSATSVQILFAAFRSEYQVTLEYAVNEMRGKSYRCITGITVSKI